MNKKDIKLFQRQALMYEAYVNGFGYLRWSRKKHKMRIAISKKTWWIIKNRLK